MTAMSKFFGASVEILSSWRQFWKKKPAECYAAKQWKAFRVQTIPAKDVLLAAVRSYF